MKKLLLLALLLGPIFSFAQEINLAELLTGIDSSLLVDANEVVREEVTHLKVLDPETVELNYKQKVTLLNAKASSKTIYTLYSKDIKISKLKATIYDRFGQEVKSYKMKDFMDQSAISSGTIYADSRVKYLQLEPPSYPCTIEWEYSQKHKSVYCATYPDWLPQGYYQSVEKATYTIEIPAEQDLLYKQVNIDDKPQEKEIDDYKSYTWTLENLAAKEKEAYGPARYDVLPVVLAISNQFSIDGYAGSMKSWNDYGKFMLQLFEGRDKLPPALASQVKKITANAASDREKIELLYRFMQENSRYVSVQLGLGGWQPFSAQYVYDNGYGDCKALSNYMYAMLKEVDIESYPTIINAGQADIDLDPGFASPQFNHMILYVPSEDMWLECTSTYGPANYLGRRTSDQPVLWITPEGGKVSRTPKLNWDGNRKVEEVNIVLDEKGAAQLSFNGNYHNGTQEVWRYYEFYTDSKDKEEFLRERTNLPNFSLTKLDIKSDRTAPRSVVNCEMEIPRYAAKAGKRLFVPINSIFPLESVPDADEDREYPIHINYGFNEEVTINFTLPEGYKVEGLPIKEEEVTSSFGRYEAKTTVEGNQLIYTRKLKIEDQVLPPTAYEKFREFYLKVAKLDGAKMVLVQQKT